jgi:hypothetical protein
MSVLGIGLQQNYEEESIRTKLPTKNFERPE